MLIPRHRTSVLHRPRPFEIEPVDWIRCNICYAGSHDTKGRLWFTSCGHLLCLNCLQKTNGSASVCIVCHRPNAKFTEVNRRMGPELLKFFRPPWDLYAEFSARLREVTDFQQNHRMHLKERVMEEKLKKAAKYVQTTKSELQKTLREFDQIKAEMERYKEQIQQLQNTLGERDKEIQLHVRKLQQQQLLCKGSGRVPAASLNGNTPLTGVSFSACATSTPINAPNKPLIGELLIDDELLKTPVLHEGVVAGQNRVPDTPAILSGRYMHRESNTSSTEARYF
uniref:RING-type domain-containing protein n=1 Tax=Globodera rostochiensis TaxID=31243 RepID=A0A914H2Y8_GLORO